MSKPACARAPRGLAVPAAQRRRCRRGPSRGPAPARTRRTGRWRGRQRRHRGVYRLRARHAAVDELDAGQRAVRVHRLGQQRERRDVVVVPQPALDVAARRRESGWISTSSVQTTAQPPSALMPRMAACAVGSRCAHAVAVGHLVEAVAGGHRPDRHRLEQDVVARIAAQRNRLRGDQEPHDVARPVPDLVELGVPVPLLGERVADVAGAAEGRHGGRGREDGRLGGGELRHRRLGGERLARVGELRRAPGHQPRLLELELRVREPERDGLELVDPAPERLALARVLDGELERRAAEAERARGELDAGDVEDPHQAGEALALLAEAAVVRDVAALEGDLRGGEAAATHLRQAQGRGRSPRRRARRGTP